MSRQRVTGTGLIAQFGVGLRYEDIPEDVARKTRLFLLDTLGAGLAAHALSAKPVVAPREALLKMYPAGVSTVIGASQGLPASAAALANGTLFHGLDFDDTHAAARINVTAVIAPAVLAVAEELGSSGPEVVAALVTGAEVAIRVGLIASPAFLTTGFHPTSVCGVFGVTMAVAKLYGLGEREVQNALALAGSTASGLYEHFTDGSSTKTFHAGWAAHSGIMAALLAAAGADGPATVLEGRYGVFKSHFDVPAEQVVGHLETLGGLWESRNIAFRPYPACNMIHSSLDAARQLMGGRRLQATEIVDVKVCVPEDAVSLVLEPSTVKKAPRNAYDAKFSLPFSLAAMLVHGDVNVQSYTPEAIGDPEVLAVASKVRYETRAFPTYPTGYPCEVFIETTQGESLSLRMDFHRGGPELPMSEGEVVEKFRANAGLVLEESQTSLVVQEVLSLHELEDVARTMNRLRGRSDLRG